MTVAFLCALLDRIVEEPDLYERVQKAREVRLILAPLVAPPSRDVPELTEFPPPPETQPHA